MKTNQDRKTLLFAAGGVTGLIAITVLALGIGPSNFAFAESSAAAVTPTVEVAAPTASPPATADANEQLAQALDQNAQLRQALALMQEREAVYRRQLEQAGQDIQSLQAALDQPAAAWNGDDDHDEDEAHEDREDHEDHERDHDFREHAGREHDDD